MFAVPTSSHERRSTTLLAVLIASAATALSAHAQAEAPSVTPYRPSVSTPAALSAPGWLELEAGTLVARASDPAHRASLPYTLKLAFTPDWGIRLGGEAWVRQADADGTRTSGAGDTSVVLKRRFAIDEARAFGVEVGANVSTATPALGSGHNALLVTGIYSADLPAGLHSDLNIGVTRATSAEADASRVQSAGAASLSGPIANAWGWVAEVSGTHQRGIGASSQWLVAVTCNVSRSATLDVGMSGSLRSPRSDGAWFAGVTVLAGRLFP